MENTTEIFNKAAEIASYEHSESIASSMLRTWRNSRDYTNSTALESKIKIPWDLIDKNFNCVRINSDRRVVAFTDKNNAELCGQNGRWLTNGLYLEITDLIIGDTSKLDSSSFIAIRGINVYDEEELINCWQFWHNSQSSN